MRYSLLILTLIFLIGCQSTPVLTNFNKEKWLNDINGCQSTRKALYDVISNQKEQLVGLEEHQIISVLGPPDKEELYIRGQKFFAYYMEPSSACANSVDTPLILKIRYSALGLTSEVFFENQ